MIKPALILFALGLAACNPTLVSESAAPPGRAGWLDAENGFWGVKRYKVELSQGVAMALSCHDGGPCEHMTATSDAPAIAEVRPAALQKTQVVTVSGLRKPTAAIVIVGKAPGTTTLRIRSKDGDRDVQITVVPPPAS